MPSTLSLFCWTCTLFLLPLTQPHHNQSVSYITSSLPRSFLCFFCFGFFTFMTSFTINFVHRRRWFHLVKNNEKPLHPCPYPCPYPYWMLLHIVSMHVCHTSTFCWIIFMLFLPFKHLQICAWMWVVVVETICMAIEFATAT